MTPIEALLAKRAAHNGNQPFLLGESRNYSYSEFYAAARAVAHGLDAQGDGLVASRLGDSTDLILLMLGAAMSHSSLLLLSSETDDSELAERHRQLGFTRCFTDAAEVAELAASGGAEPSKGGAGRAAELLILTSGTSGEPKCARYAWNDLLQQIPETAADASQRWLLAYRLTHFAGVQMLLHVLAQAQTLVVPKSSRVADALAAARLQGVTHISSTPTFWRFALAAKTDFPADLRHITLGSEAVTDNLLQALARAFPAARIVHIYATTELGSCVSVSDGRAGLPLDILQRDASAAVQFRIQNDELWVKSRHGMRAYLNPDDEPASDDGWRPTGDLVRIAGERILFAGRLSEMINVGGVKVSPSQAEECVSALPEIKLVRAYGRDNPVMGQVVAVDIVLQEGALADIVEQRVREACRELSRHAQPRSINFVAELATRNMKLERR